jgi:hypothetical protein
MITSGSRNEPKNEQQAAGLNQSSSLKGRAFGPRDRTGNWPSGRGRRSYYELARPASCTTLPQRITSAFTNACSSSSDPLPIGLTPRLTSCCLTSAVFTIAFTSALSLARIGLGVFAGAISGPGDVKSPE